MEVQLARHQVDFKSPSPLPLEDLSNSRLGICLGCEALGAEELRVLPRFVCHPLSPISWFLRDRALCSQPRRTLALSSVAPVGSGRARAGTEVPIQSGTVCRRRLWPLARSPEHVLLCTLLPFPPWHERKRVWATATRITIGRRVVKGGQDVRVLWNFTHVMAWLTVKHWDVTANV